MTTLLNGEESKPFTAEEAAEVIHQAGTTIDADIDVDGDGDNPGYSDEASSTFTKSVSSSVMDYVFENGRRYNRFQQGLYNMPLRRCPL